MGETIRVCQKHNIPYFVIGGTAIGALYDQAILPWDDDIDIGMTRENYNNFLKVAPGELGPSYFLSWIETDPHTPYYFAKALRYVDGSFIKIKNITLGYSLPKSILKSAGIEKCRFYATITNPFVFAKSHLLKDYDPEMNGSLKYPLTKQFVFGVNVTF